MPSQKARGEGWSVIKVTKLNHKEIIISANHIELIESTPDTTITMTTGRKIIVLETLDEILEKFDNRVSQNK